MSSTDSKKKDKPNNKESNNNSKEKLPEKIVLGDTYTMKHHLDMCVCETMKEQGYPEIFLLKNIKLVLGLGSVICAFTAQFGHYIGLIPKFPQGDSWYINLVLVLGYLIFSGISALIDWFMIGEFELDFKGPDNQKIRVCTKLPKYSEMYTVKYQLIGQDGKKQHEDQIEKSVEKYFHADGYLAPKKLKEDVGGLVKQIQTKKSQ
eukprot:TRINITY_DN4701_c0_g1_i1.p2 TRINITY_DN4701_c0_g1~~TRINITY_DN4701_c0_g1_i1.p2  ORF type:complete len:205 (-),score=19.32 TRINITY_DN4701_c0_g1_i1:110-724(-)